MADLMVTINMEDTQRLMIDLLDRSKDYTPAFEAAAIQMERSVGMNFRAQGRPKWRALKASTLRGRRLRGKGGQILADGGTLKASVTSNVNVKIIAPLRYEFGTNVVYAGVHNFGYRRIPQRQFLMFQDADVNIIKRIFADFIDGTL